MTEQIETGASHPQERKPSLSDALNLSDRYFTTLTLFSKYVL